MINVIEPNKTASQHITFNAAILNALSDFEINFFVSKSAQDFYNRSDKLRKISIPVVDGDSRKFIKKALIEFIVLIYFLIKTGRSTKSLILSISPNVLVLIEIFCTIFGYKKVICIIHGELEGLVEKDKSSITSYGYWIKKWFLMRELCGEISPVFLSEYVYKNLLNHGFIKSNLFNKFYLIELPPPALGYSVVNKFQEFTIAFIGTRSVRKGYGPFLTLVESLSTRGDIDFYSLGSGRLINHSKEIEKIIDPGTYLDILLEFDVAIFPASDSYLLTVSSAINDAFAAGLLVLAMDSSMARHYQKILGMDSIEIFENLEAMLSRVEEINKDLVRSKREVRLRNLANSKLGFDLNAKSIRNFFNEVDNFPKLS
jgi:hypothetical protein